MSTEQNKAMTQKVYDAFNRKDLGALDQYITADAVDHEVPPGFPPGLEGTKQFLGVFFKAFPDLHVTAHDMIAEGDKVVARAGFTGTHTGEFLNIPSTGKKVSVSAIDVLRFERGKLVEHWGLTDQLGLMQQIGVIPPPGQPPQA